MTSALKFGLLTSSSLGKEIFYSNFLTEENLKIYTEVKEYCLSKHSYKIAILDNSINTHNTDKTTRKIVTSASDYVVLHNMDIHPSCVDYMLNEGKNYNYSLSGIVNYPIKQIKSMEWISSTANFYKNNLNFILKDLRPFEKKQYYFDFLPGVVKPHRQFIMNYINKNFLQDKIFCGEFFQGEICHNYEDSTYWDEEIVKGSLNHFISGHQVLFHNNKICLGQIIPRKIFINSCYSIVAETHYENSFSYYTEKTIKPLLSSRLFIIIAGRHYLKNLRSLGFQTFSDIIDESYDEIENNEIRWNEALKQVSFLCEEPQEVVLKKITPIVTHNYRLAMSYDWITPLRNHIEDKFIENI